MEPKTVICAWDKHIIGIRIKASLEEPNNWDDVAAIAISFYLLSPLLVWAND